MSYNPNNPSNWSWKKAFEEHAKYVNQAELTSQCINHVAGYPGEAIGLYMTFEKQAQNDVYEILNEIL